jgi:hypothetical protein
MPSSKPFVYSHKFLFIETKRTPILSKLKSIRTTHHVSVTSTISTLKPAAQEQKTSSVLSVMGTHNLQSTMKQTNSFATVQSAQSSSDESSKLAGVKTTKTTENGVQSTSNTLPTSQMNEYSSPETKNMATSNRPVQVTASSMFHNFKTTSKGKSMTSTSSLDTRKSSVVSNVASTFHPGTSIPDSKNTDSSSSLNIKHVSTSNTSPMLSKRKTETNGVTSSSTILTAKVAQSTEISNQNPTPSSVFIAHSTSVTKMMSSKSSSESSLQNLPLTTSSQISSVHVSHVIRDSLTTEVQEHGASSKFLMDATTSTLHPHTAVSTTTHSSHARKSTSTSRVQSASFQSSTAFVDNNKNPPSSSEIGPSHSTATTIIQHSLEITPKLNSSAVVSTISANVLPSQTTKLPSLNKSHTTEHSASNRISTSINHHTSSRMLTPTMSLISGASASINVNTSDMTTAKIKPTKTSITPVVSSSVWIPPYYHQWSNWSKCSRDCGGGYTYQTRNCSRHGQCDDLGPGINTTICNLYKCNGEF